MVTVVLMWPHACPCWRCLKTLQNPESWAVIGSPLHWLVFFFFFFCLRQCGHSLQALLLELFFPSSHTFPPSPVTNPSVRATSCLISVTHTPPISAPSPLTPCFPYPFISLSHCPPPHPLPDVSPHSHHSLSVCLPTRLGQWKILSAPRFHPPLPNVKFPQDCSRSSFGIISMLLLFIIIAERGCLCGNKFRVEWPTLWPKLTHNSPETFFSDV